MSKTKAAKPAPPSTPETVADYTDPYFDEDGFEATPEDGPPPGYELEPKWPIVSITLHSDIPLHIGGRPMTRFSFRRDIRGHLPRETRGMEAFEEDGGLYIAVKRPQKLVYRLPLNLCTVEYDVERPIQRAEPETEAQAQPGIERADPPGQSAPPSRTL